MFLGLRMDIPALLDAMDFFVLPSWYEGLLVVAVEAQASGLPIIVSDRVTTEIKMTQRINSLSLDLDAKTWATTILSQRKTYDRTCQFSELRTVDYDIVSAAKNLEKWYLER